VGAPDRRALLAKWQKSVESVIATGPLSSGIHFSWRTGGTNIHSQVRLFEPERRLSWTGTAFTAKAAHVWELRPESGNQTIARYSGWVVTPLERKILHA
jgi:hypothetical protein